MNGFYILKPDIIDDNNALDYYLSYISNSELLSLKNFYKIDDWIKLSKILYEPRDQNLPSEELERIRRQMIITIMGYERYYGGKTAILSMIEIQEGIDLQELYNFKKRLRTIFVSNSKKYYLRFIDKPDFKKKLVDIDTSQINGIYTSLESYETQINSEYEMIFFNKIHFSDPSLDSIREDEKCLIDTGIIKTKNLIRNIR